MSVQFTQISYKEVIFNFDISVFKPGDSISVKMAPLMKTVEANNDVIALQLTVEYESKNTKILKYGGIALFFAGGWKEFITDEDKFNRFKVNIWTQALGFFRGVICEKVRGTLIEPFFIPQMPERDIIPIPLK